MIKNCVMCGKPVIQNNARQVVYYCSRECRKAYRAGAWHLKRKEKIR